MLPEQFKIFILLQEVLDRKQEICALEVSPDGSNELAVCQSRLATWKSCLFFKLIYYKKYHCDIGQSLSYL